jgi:hypothetical protein
VNLNNLKLDKRSWLGYITVKEGKWFTGYSGDILENKPEHWYSPQCKFCIPVTHEVRELTLKPVTTQRGRSSAVAIWEDKEGFKYDISFSGTFKMLQTIMNDSDEFEVIDGFITAKFVQTKQGANYFIEMVEE